MDRTGYDKYREMQIKTASQGSLILMLYDGAIRFIRYALEGMKERKFDAVNNNLIKAQNIVLELMMSLNLNTGDIAASLQSIYDFLYRHLIQANIKKDEKIMMECLDMLVELREMWNQVAKNAEKV